MVRSNDKNDAIEATGPSLPVVDAHTHVFCWGENHADGFMSDVTQRALLTRLLVWMTKLKKESGETLSAKMRNRLLRHLRESSLDYAIVLAQDAVYREDGSRNDAATHFYVSNDYVFELARECPKVLPGVSINLWRGDALQELERCHAAGSRLVKIHTAIQGVDPSLERFDSFYRLARDLGMVLTFHTGYEHTCRVVAPKIRKSGIACPTPRPRVDGRGSPCRNLRILRRGGFLPGLRANDGAVSESVRRHRRVGHDRPVVRFEETRSRAGVAVQPDHSRQRLSAPARTASLLVADRIVSDGAAESPRHGPSDQARLPSRPTLRKPSVEACAWRPSKRDLRIAKEWRSPVTCLERYSRYWSVIR